jgi:hypothetical protein
MRNYIRAKSDCLAMVSSFIKTYSYVFLQSISAVSFQSIVVASMIRSSAKILRVSLFKRRLQNH